MSQPQWQDVTGDDEESPFWDGGDVDGIVYSEEELSPELSFHPSDMPALPPVPVRDEPLRAPDLPAAPWNPAPVSKLDHLPIPRRANPVKVVVLGLLPIVIAGALVWAVIQMYGGAV